MRQKFKVWFMMAAMSLEVQLTYPLGSIGFFLGKLIRIVFFFAFVIAIFAHTQTLGRYSLVEVALFFLTFNVVDITAQIFFRGIYNVRRAVMEGDFDFYLIQPYPPLLRLALNTVDFLDLGTFLPLLVLVGIVFARLPGHLGLWNYAMYVLLTFNGIAIAFALHVFVAALAVRTQELENAIWIYRDLMFLGKFPTDIYGAVVQQALIWVIPIAVMVTFPAKALLGLLSPAWALYSLGLCFILVSASLMFWRSCVRHYTSSSS